MTTAMLEANSKNVATWIALGMHRERAGAMAASHFYFAPRASNRG